MLPIANAAIARMENRAIDKLTKLELDIGSEAPTLTSVAVTPSLTGYDFVDVDVGVLYHGYRVRLDMEANLGGDELPDVFLRDWTEVPATNTKCWWDAMS